MPDLQFLNPKVFQTPDTFPRFEFEGFIDPVAILDADPMAKGEYIDNSVVPPSFVIFWI